MLADQRPPVTAVVQQHVDETAHLYTMRRILIRAPHVGLLHLRRLDERIAAHLDGLMESGAAGRAMCREALAEAGAGEIFAATAVALRARDVPGLDCMLALAASLPKAQPGLRSAFGWIPSAALKGVTRSLLDAPDTFRRGVGLTACAMHQVDPGTTLAAALADGNAVLRSHALRVAAACGRTDLLPTCLALLTDADSGHHAARAALLLGDREASVQALQTTATTKGPHRIEALQLALKVLAPPDAHRLLKTLAQAPSDLRALVSGVGAAGDSHYMTWLIKQMDDPRIARLAGESFSMITGLDLALLDLDREPPEDVEPVPNEDPDDEDVAMDENDSLPWPAPDKIATWRRADGHRLSSGTRYFMGQPPSQGHCLNVLKTGFQRQRAAAAEYLALMRPGMSLFSTAAPAWRQERLLAQMGA